MNRSSTGKPVLPEISSQRWLKHVVIVLSGMLLGACGDNQMAYFNGNNQGQSASLVREQAYMGGPWKTVLVVGSDPLCQRRYPLEDLTGDQLSINVFQPGPSVYILDTGKRWYVTELQSCDLQTYKIPPPEPGELIGSFKVENGALRYADKLSAKAASKGQTAAR